MLARAGSTAAERALRGSGRAVEWLALERGFDWWGADLREERGRLRFRAFCKGRYVTELRLQVPGRRNVLCAWRPSPPAAVWAFRPWRSGKLWKSLRAFLAISSPAGATEVLPW